MEDAKIPETIPEKRMEIICPPPIENGSEVVPPSARRINGSHLVKTRPQRRLTQKELDAFLEKAADTLRGGVDHSEFRGYVFALLFYKRINDVYLENVAALEKDLGDAKLARDPRMHDFVVPDDCLWEKIARTTERDLGKALNDAMLAIERANAPKFDGILSNSTVDFNAQDRLPRSKLVQIINHFGSRAFDRASVPDDVFGNAYEYLILNFASKAGKQSGEFYTHDQFAQDVRLVLVSAEFSKEITTSVIWLNERGLDIRCVRLKPYNLDADNLRKRSQASALRCPCRR